MISRSYEFWFWSDISKEVKQVIRWCQTGIGHTTECYTLVILRYLESPSWSWRKHQKELYVRVCFVRRTGIKCWFLSKVISKWSSGPPTTWPSILYLCSIVSFLWDKLVRFVLVEVNEMARSFTPIRKMIYVRPFIYI